MSWLFIKDMKLKCPRAKGLEWEKLKAFKDNFKSSFKVGTSNDKNNIFIKP